jgi:hypothetical protein
MSEQQFFVQVDGTPGAPPAGTAGIAAVLRGVDGRVLLLQAQAMARVMRGEQPRYGGFRVV